MVALGIFSVARQPSCFGTSKPKKIAKSLRLPEDEIAYLLNVEKTLPDE